MKEVEVIILNLNDHNTHKISTQYRIQLEVNNNQNKMVFCLLALKSRIKVIQK